MNKKVEILEINGDDYNLYNYAHNATYENVGTIKLGPKVKTVTSSAFSGLPESNVYISEGVERINRHAFRKNVNLETIVLPESLEYLDPDAFSGCTSLKIIACSKKIAEELLEILSKKPAKETPVVMVISYSAKSNSTCINLIKGQKHATCSKKAIKETEGLIKKVQQELIERKGMQEIDLCRDFEEVLGLKPCERKTELSVAR